MGADSLLRIVDCVILVLLVAVKVVTTERVSGSVSQASGKMGHMYVRRFIPREAEIGAAALFVTVFLAIGFGDAPSLAGTGGGRAVKAGRVGLGFGGSSDFDRRSPMVALRRAVGILLMRISTRDRRCCAWTLYCALSLRARSVTVEARLAPAKMSQTRLKTYVRAAGCLSGLVFAV